MPFTTASIESHIFEILTVAAGVYTGGLDAVVKPASYWV